MPLATSDKFLIFKVATETLAFPLLAVQEILPVASVTRPPDAPAWFHGFLRLGPETLSVVKLAPLLGLPQSPLSLEAQFIQLTKGPLWFVDRVEQIVAGAELTPVPEGHLINEYAAGMFRDQAQDVIVLQPERLLLAEERHRVEQIAARERARREAAARSDG